MNELLIRMYLKAWAQVLFEELTYYLWETCVKCQNPQRFKLCDCGKQHSLKIYQDQSLLHKKFLLFSAETPRAFSELESMLKDKPHVTGRDVIHWQSRNPDFNKWSYIKVNFSLFKKLMEEVYDENCCGRTIFEYLKGKYDDDY